MNTQPDGRWICETCGYFNDRDTTEKCARCNASTEFKASIPEPPTLGVEVSAAPAPEPPAFTPEPPAEDLSAEHQL